MNDHCEQAKSVFLNALDCDPAEVANYLNDACRDNDELRRQVEVLLEGHRRGADLAERAIAACEEAIPSEIRNTVDIENGAKIGPYKIREQIGEGGMGIVYVAEQTEPVRRKVALKVIKPGMDSKEIIARFESERQALAMMEHPNIARIHDGGITHAGHSYFVMELVRGIPITEFCDKARLSPKDRLGLFTDVCDAVQHAHQKGIIHRDIKPANVLITEIDGKAVVKVIDFGLAKATGNLRLTDQTVYTRFMNLMGTPKYMSPEQAGVSGVDVDTRSDIYSLGVLLYELLTGKTPLDTDSMYEVAYEEICRQVREVDAPKPSQRISTLNDEERTSISHDRRVDARKLSHELRGDLDWIVLKSLEKERRRRYETANAFGADIKRYLNHEPVSAVAPSPVYVLRKYAQRHRFGLATVAAFVALLLVGAVVSTSLAIRANNEAQRAEAEASRANKAAHDEKQARLTAEQLEEKAKREAERFRQLSYLSDMNAALHVWHTGDVGRAANMLRRHLPQEGKEDLRRFEWFYLFGLCQRSLMTPTIECSSGAVAYSSDGKRIAFGDGQKVKVLDVATGCATDCVRHEAPVTDVTFSPDGQILASASNAGVILLCDLETDTPRPPLKHGGHVLSVAFSPDSTTLTTSSWPARNAKLWEVETGRELAELKHKYPVTSVAFSNDGSTLASCDWKGTLSLWNTQTFAEQSSYAGHSGPGKCVAFSPCTDVLATAGVDGLVKLWNATGGKLTLLGRLEGHAGGVEDLAFSPNGETLSSCGKDNTIILWKVSTREKLDIFRGSPSVDALAFAPNGKTLAAASQNGIKLWDVSQRPPPDVLTGPTGAVAVAAFSPNGKTFVSCGWDRIVRVWDTERWRSQKELPHDGEVFCVAISPDGKTLATVGTEKIIRLWDLDTAEPVAELVGHPGWIWSVSFSPDGKMIASAGGGGSSKHGTVRLFDIASETEVESYRYDGHAGAARSASFSPDGKLMASGSVDGTVRLWEFATQADKTLTTDAVDLWSVMFSPDGNKLAATAGRKVKLWDLVTGEELTLEGHTARIMQASFAPDGMTLATAGYEGVVKLWDPDTGELQFTFRGIGTEINHIAFSADSKLIALCCRDATIRLLRAATEENVHAAGWYEDPD